MGKWCHREQQAALYVDARQNFLKKIHFTSEGDYNYETPLNEAIERVLRKNSALQK